MINWIFSNWVNILLIAVLCLICGGILRSLIRRKKQGCVCGGCSCGCAGGACGGPKSGGSACTTCHHP